jgi:hypothetical protein
LSFETLVIEIDVAVPPKIKTSYSKLSTGAKEPPEPYIEGLDPACGQANSTSVSEVLSIFGRFQR